MKLVEQHIIKSNHKHYKELDNLCLLSKNLYNASLYVIRQHFFQHQNDKENGFLNYYALNKLFKETNQKDYRSLPANTAQEVLKLVNQNFKSFFSLLSSKRNKTYVKRISIPRYLNKKTGRQIVIYNHMTLSSNLLKNGIIKLPKTNIEFKTKQTNIKQVRLIPRNSYILFEVVYEINENLIKNDNNRYLGMDLGINNLASCSSNVTNSFIINGKPIKSINQFYNKKLSKLQSDLYLKHKKYTSKNISNLTLKRNNKIKDYFHKTSKYIVNHAVDNSINTIIIGYNKEWKQETNIGRKNNQNFVQIPHMLLVNLISYKAKLKGINVIIQEESYTSKVSFFDNEFIPTFKKSDNMFTSIGKRIKRGLFKTPSILINADINGALNIMRKYLNVASDEILSPTCRGFVVNPVKISF